MIFNMTGEFAGKVRAISAETVESLPENVRDGTIAIITSTKIADVYVQNKEPEDPDVGTVWISTGLDSKIPIQVGNVVVYPSAAKQMVGGEWVEVKAKTRQEGAWVDWWGGEHYLPGDMFEDLTGGWKVVANTGAKVDFDENGMNFSLVSTASRQVSVYTNNKVNVTDYSTMIVEANLEQVDESFTIGLSEQNTANKSSFTHSSVQSEATNGKIEMSVDISSATGEFYLAMYSYACTGLVTKVVLR